MSDHSEQQPWARKAARVGLGAFMIAAGASHLTVARQEFRAQVPPWVPGDPDLTVLASGFAEIALGAAQFAPQRYRRTAGVALAGFYTAIFPGNVSQYTQGRSAFGLDTDGKRLARLFLQPVLIGLALYGGNVGVRSAAD